jgi:hypothetical protein
MCTNIAEKTTASIIRYSHTLIMEAVDPSKKILHFYQQSTQHSIQIPDGGDLHISARWTVTIFQTTRLLQTKICTSTQFHHLLQPTKTGEKTGGVEGSGKLIHTGEEPPKSYLIWYNIIWNYETHLFQTSILPYTQ